MSDWDQIQSIPIDRYRNVSIVSHIDHGKTTLSDFFLSLGHLVAPSLAGKARALDYLPEEQRRGITIKTANVTFSYNYKNEEYLINLVDTPGHVDFSGAVTQALRLVDGVIIVIDAVEGVMAQTETVLRQVVKEKLFPILYVNKIDRLINELKLPIDKIAERLDQIIGKMNHLYNLFLEDEFSEKKARKDVFVFNKGSVIVGSALHGWAISNYSLERYNLSFQEIITLYQKDQTGNQIRKIQPIQDTVAEALIKTLPSPSKAHEDRLNHLLISPIKSRPECTPDAPFLASSGKSVYDNDRRLTIIRIFSGKINRGDTIYSQHTKSKGRIDRIYLLKGESKTNISSATAGLVVGIVGIDNLIGGETLTKEVESNLSLKDITYVQEPVISMSIEPSRTKHLSKLLTFLEKTCSVDPNLEFEQREDTGEIIIHGIGELQLEILTSSIEENEIKLIVSEPIVTLTEQVTNYATNDFNIEYLNVSFKGEIFKEKSMSKFVHYFKDKRKNELAFSIKLSNEDMDGIIEGFKLACRYGPLTKNRIRGVKIVINSVNTPSNQQLGYEQSLMISKNIFHLLFIQKEVKLFEPVYSFELTTPDSYLGSVLAVLQRYKCTIISVDTKNNYAKVVGKLRVVSSFQITKDLRRESNGHAFWQLQVSDYQIVSD
ncbi:MAG: GTP-binding protein [Candidatus Kariarchaeaceae archaeon]